VSVGLVANTEEARAVPGPRAAVEVPRDRVADRAYGIWLRNGRPEGTADRDWLQAEAELRAGDLPGAGPVAPDQPPPHADRRDTAAAVGDGRVRPAPATRGTVRLSGNVRLVTRTEWLGAPAVDSEGRIERSVDLPDEVYGQIERSIARGSIEGFVFLDGQRRVDWFLDR
jgi:hypothetical protein